MEEQIEYRVVMLQQFGQEDVLNLMRVDEARVGVLALGPNGAAVCELERSVGQPLFVAVDWYLHLNLYMYQVVYNVLMIKNLASQVGQSYSFICPQCLQSYNHTDRLPIQVCPHHHSCCLHCLEQDLFKNISQNHSVACKQCHSFIKRGDAKPFQFFQEIQKTASQLRNSEGKADESQSQANIDKLRQQLAKSTTKTEWLIQQYFALKKLYRTQSQLHERSSHKYNRNIEKFVRISWESQGYKLYSEGKFKEAIELCQDILRAAPGLDYKICGVGNVQDRAGVNETFLASWCQNNYQEYDNPYDVLCLSYHRLQNYEEAQNWYKYRLGKDSKNYRIVLGLANVLYNQGKYQKAEQLYLQTIELNPNLEKSYRMLAFIKNVKESRKDEGKKWATLAKEKYQSFYADYLLAISEEAPDAQIQQINKIPQATLKNYPRIYNALGSAFKHKKELDQSIKSFKKCIQLSPSYEVPYFNLGVIHQERGQLQEAIKYYEQSIKINQNYANPYIGLANIYTQRKGQQEKAINWLQKCIAINPTHIPAYNGLGKAYAIKEQFDDAVTAFNKCIELNPKHELSHNSLGNVYFYKGQYDEAIKWYQKSIEINPKYVNPYGGLCNAYGKKGDEESARKWLQKKDGLLAVQ